MDNDISIKVNNVSKSFKLPHEKNSSLKGMLINFGKRGYEKQQVLDNISFEIKKGEFFGIVGRNGSGKSTLLRLLAGIYSPDSGNIEINGKLTPFIELGVGFNPELTGRENVFLNCALLGFSRKEVTAMYQDIVDFSELERFMDQKLKNYSSGMQVRLAFSVAIRAESDILLIDEVLAVGDQSFQEKCFNYFTKIKKSGKTVIFVTHDMSNVERFCDRVLVIDRKKEANGLYAVPEAVAIYNELNHERIESTDIQDARSSAGLHIKRVRLLDEKRQPTENFKQGSPLTVEIEIDKGNLKENIPIVLGLAFHDNEDLNLSGPNSKEIPITSQDKFVIYHIDKLPFTMGNYYLTVALLGENSTKQYDLINKGIQFFVNTQEILYGKIVLDGKWAKK